MTLARLRGAAHAVWSGLRAASGEPLFFLAWAAIAGILAGEWSGNGSALWWTPAVGIAAWWFARIRKAASLAFLTLTVFALTHRLQLHDPVRALVEARAAPGRALPAELTGVVEDAPEQFTSGGGLWRFPVRVLALRVNGEEWPPAGAKLYVVLQDPLAIPVYGDTLSLTGVLTRADATRNPGEFDFGAFLRVNGYAAEFSATGGQDVMAITARGGGNPVLAAALRSREWIGAAVSADLEDSPDIAAVVRTMMLGTREKTPREIEDAFRVSGTMHIFAVSGLHVALFAFLLRSALGVFGLRPAVVTALSIALMFFYVYITGLRPSAWRAAIMTALVLSGPLLNRESGMLNHLGAAALLLLSFDTLQLFQPGFVLSFGVILALAALQKPAAAAAGWLMGKWSAPDPFLPESLRSRRQRAWYGFRHWLCEGLGLSVASTIGSLPLMIGYFRIITPVGIVANLFLITLSTGILIMACVSLVATGAGLKILALCCNNMNWGLAWICVSLAKFFAALPGAYVRVDPTRLWRGDPCEITVLALDRGGGAIRIDSPEGRQWLVDCGGLRHFGRTLRPHLERAPVNRLDGLILTHRDGDHTGGFADVSALFFPRAVWRPAGEGGRGISELSPGEPLKIDAMTTLTPLFPPPGWTAGPVDDQCAVLRLECRGFRVLFMGDAGFLTEKALLEAGADLRADVLVKGRHASDYSGLPEFLNAVRPAAVVFTDNTFPGGEQVPEDWVRLLSAKSIRAFNQRQTGGVILRIDRQGLGLRGFVNGQTFSLPARVEER